MNGPMLSETGSKLNTKWVHATEMSKLTEFIKHEACQRFEDEQVVDKYELKSSRRRNTSRAPSKSTTGTKVWRKTKSTDKTRA